MTSERFRPDWLPSWETYARERRIDLLGKGDERRAVCPIHGGGRDSLAINIKTGKWLCHSCGAHGTTVFAFHRAR